MRGLSEKFRHDLKEGSLKDFLSLIKNDGTIILDIRENYVYLFYRGGALYKISPSGDSYDFGIDVNYFSGGYWDKNAMDLLKQKRYFEAIPYLKSAMDWHISKNRTDEKEVCDRIVRDNNTSSAALNSDYYLVGKEYALPTGGRPDLVAVEYNTKSRNGETGRLSLIEVKHGINAVEGASGIEEHIADAQRFFADSTAVKSLGQEVVALFNQQKELGLVDVAKPITEIGGKPEYILLFANATPKSSIIRGILERYKDTDYVDFDLKIALSSNMGYALYSNCLVSISEYLQTLD